MKKRKDLKYASHGLLQENPPPPKKNQQNLCQDRVQPVEVSNPVHSEHEHECYR
jgi:hypothetical protein